MSALVISTTGPSFRPAPLKLAPMKLTRRGRMVLLGIPAIVLGAALLFSLLAVLLGALASPANASTNYAPIDMAGYAATVTVLQGDSIWSIAAAADSSRDVRDVVAEIVALNELRTSVLQAGQQLYVPLHR